MVQKLFRSAVYLGCAFLFSVTALAQEPVIKQPAGVIKISLQHLLINGLHLELERSLKAGSRHSILLSPRIYAGSTDGTDNFTSRSSSGEEAGDMRGYGVEIQHRIYVKELSESIYNGLYFAYGINYTHYKIDFERYGWTSLPSEDGLEYYTYTKLPYTEKINRFGGIATLGYQYKALDGALILDCYVGSGMRYSSTDSNYNKKIYNINAFDFGHTGAYLHTGFKIGLLL